MPGPTITVQGEGGAVSQVDVPDEGTVARELFDDHLAKGRYVVLSGDWPPAEGDDAPAEGTKRSRGKGKKAAAEPAPEAPVEEVPTEVPAEGDDAPAGTDA